MERDLSCICQLGSDLQVSCFKQIHEGTNTLYSLPEIMCNCTKLFQPSQHAFTVMLGSCSVSCGIYLTNHAQLKLLTKLMTQVLVCCCCCRAELQQTGEELLSAFSLANGALEYIPPVGVDGLTIKSAAQKTKGLHLYKSQCCSLAASLDRSSRHDA